MFCLASFYFVTENIYNITFFQSHSLYHALFPLETYEAGKLLHYKLAM